jgi:RimJ/RimL family protein N-acetyltransferase
MAWLPDDFAHPLRADLPTGHHLRPIRADDVEIDFPAVMGSRERLWTIYGQAWGWPPAHMTPEQDREDLAHHEREIEGHQSFNYALLPDDESELLGCVYVDPPEKAGDAGAEVSWWVVDALVGTGVERALDEFVPRWLAEEWALPAPPRLVGRDLSWAEWIALPGREAAS